MSNMYLLDSCILYLVLFDLCQQSYILVMCQCDRRFLIPNKYWLEEMLVLILNKLLSFIIYKTSKTIISFGIYNYVAEMRAPPKVPGQSSRSFDRHISSCSQSLLLSVSFLFSYSYFSVNVIK